MANPRRAKSSRCRIVPTSFSISGSPKIREHPERQAGRGPPCGIRESSRLPEMREDLLAQEADGAQHLGLLHARPLDADDQCSHSQAHAVARNLLADPRGIAEEEAVAGERLEVGGETLAGRQRLVLLPLPIGLVLGAEMRARLGNGGG